MAAVPSSAEGGGTPPNERKIHATVEIREISEVIPAAITTTVNAPVTPFSSVPAHTSDQPLQQQNESRPIVTATPAPQPNAMSRSPTNTNTITNTNTNQVQEPLPFRSLRSIAPSTDPDGQTIQEL